MLKALPAAVALALVGCSNPPPQTFTVSFPTLTVPAGTERTQCIIKRLGNPGQIHVGQIHNVLGPSSHHMIVYRVTDTVEQPTPTDCTPFTEALDPTKGSPLMITQKKDDLLALPPGVAYTLDANQMLRIELHYINATSSDVQLTASTAMKTTSEFQYEANFIFTGTIDITLPPNTTTTVGPEYFPMSAADLGDINVFAITGHEHQYGTGVSVATTTSASDPGTTVYNPSSWLWSEPTTVMHEPPFKMSNASGFNFSCTWDNTSANTIKFGESANAEMCFFWAYYYPSRGSEICIHTKQDNGHDFCCPGAWECAFFVPKM
jgi:hypothetical protein